VPRWRSMKAEQARRGLRHRCKDGFDEAGEGLSRSKQKSTSGQLLRFSLLCLLRRDHRQWEGIAGVCCQEEHAELDCVGNHHLALCQ